MRRGGEGGIRGFRRNGKGGVKGAVYIDAPVRVHIYCW